MFKSFIFAVITTLSINVYAQGEVFDLEGFKEVGRDAAIDISNALALANNGYFEHGSCGTNLDWPIQNESVTVYVSESGFRPLIIFKGPSEFIMITSDQDMKKIVEVEFGDYEMKKANIGTLKDPIFTKIPVITKKENSYDCKL